MSVVAEPAKRGIQPRGSGIALTVVTPTRSRWSWLANQAERLSKQLGPNDRWIVVVDNDEPNDDSLELVGELCGDWLNLILIHSGQEEDHRNGVTRAYNVGVALSPQDTAIVDVDDHDLLEPMALSHIRMALEAGAHYVFGNAYQQAIIPAPDGVSRLLETWPDMTRVYSPGDFAAGKISVLGPRAYSSAVRRIIGPWRDGDWPTPDMGFARRVEEAWLHIACLPVFLSTITIDPDSISGQWRPPVKFETHTEHDDVS